MAKANSVFDLSEVRALVGKEHGLTEAEIYLTKCPVDASELRRDGRTYIRRAHRVCV